jgi:hypothetical protein
MGRPEFDVALAFWTKLLSDRGHPQNVCWVFHEDFCRMPKIVALRPRRADEAWRIARFAYAHLDPKEPLAFVAYMATSEMTITGLQGDVFTADDDIYRDDWNMFFYARNELFSFCEVVSDEARWLQLVRDQPQYLSEFDYLISVSSLQRNYGYCG